MKRYRVFAFDFDSRATSLSMEIQPDWEQEVKSAHRQNHINTVIGLIGEYGIANGQNKVHNFEVLGSKPFSVVAFHNKFYQQTRDAFVIGAYYPALTSACALGERILNHLILQLRDSFKSSSEYKKVYDKASFDNWELAIDTLEAWKILLPTVVTAYRNLSTIRNQKAIHFNPETDANDYEYALEALQLLSQIISHQFSAFGPEPWFIPNTPGSSFIKKESENLPFIQKIYLGMGNCLLVGPYHKVDVVPENNTYKFVVTDDFSYDDSEISDEEFASLYNNRTDQAG